MIRGFVHSFDVPGCDYRRPLFMAPSIGRALFEHVCDRSALLHQLMAEQRQDQNETGDGLQPIAGNAGTGGPTT